MPVNTASAAAHITAVVVKTLVNHKKRRRAREREGKEAPQDDILFDEAFHIVKAFIELGTKNTVESLQAFTNTRIPSLYWVVVSPVVIPLSTCNDAADYLIQWFGPEDLKHVVGGERWWQVRGLNGIDAEWIAEREHIGDDDVVLPPGRKLSKEEQDIIRMEKLESVMFYVHGGGYFWGSINTHRHQIVRHAHKLKGRAFAVNYRKAPQYPWPCPIQDVLAAYLYLIRPPPGAVHRAIDPRKIVFAGDSAGGGLCLVVMCILRDLGLPLPAGATLISPWVDLTHSFPSVMQNTATDIIPEHGFLAKPSVLWPLDPAPTEKTPRVAKATTNPPPKPGEADTLKPSAERAEVEAKDLDVPKNYPVETQEEMLEKYPSEGWTSTPPVLYSCAVANGKNGEGEKAGESSGSGSNANSSAIRDPMRKVSQTRESKRSVEVERIVEDWEPKPAKVLMENSIETPWELRAQIQMYATTEQLTHPLVSPITQGSLGNLPPLYILAGDGEVLRDEIIYLAHRAAHPSKFPVRESILKESTRQKENADKFTKPTNVHLQVFDGMCHVLTVFMFTKSARYAYRSIAEFIRHVTQSPEEVVAQKPFPDFTWRADTGDTIVDEKLKKKSAPSPRQRSEERAEKKTTTAAEALEDELRRDTPESDILSERSEQVEGREQSLRQPQPRKQSSVDHMEKEILSVAEVLEDELRRDSPESDILLKKNEEVERQELTRSPEPEEGRADAVVMLRERINVRGIARPMEPMEDVEILRLDPNHIGLIKEAPAMRWLRGQEEWDRRYKKRGQHILDARKELVKKSESLIRHALDQGLVHEAYPESVVENPVEKHSGRTVKRKTSIGEIQADRRWGPLDLKDEKPPGSAIAARRDTHEALALLRKSIYHTAPVTHKTVPRMKASDAFRATMDPHDNPNSPPRQSVSEQQVDRTQIAALNGLRIWEKILGYLGRKSSSKASDTYRSYKQRNGVEVFE